MPTGDMMIRICGRLERLLNPDDELQSWSISRTTHEVRVVLTFRSGCTHTIPFATSEPEFINASL